MNTNIVSFPDQVPVINLLPEKWRAVALILVALSPFIGRGFYALKQGGGIKGFCAAVWVGTNTPPK